MQSQDKSNKLVLRPQASLSIPMGQELEAILKVCEMQVASGFLPGHIQKKEQLFAIYLRARDLGIDFSAGIEHLYPVSNKDRPGVRVGQSALLQRALAYQRCPGFQIIYLSITDEECKAKATRAAFNGEWQEYTATLKEAAKQGLTERNPNYRTNPRGMLVADVTRELIRLVAPEAVTMGGGGYTSRELYDHGMTAKGEPPIDAEVVVMAEEMPVDPA